MARRSRIVPGWSRDEVVSAALARLNRFLSTRDRAIIDEFAATADVVLLGSAAEELAIGHDQLGLFFDRLFALPAQLSWDWKQTRIASAGDIAWVFAEGDVVISADGVESRSPYRMTGVLERRAGRWRWRQFHGSEPAK